MTDPRCSPACRQRVPRYLYPPPVVGSIALRILICLCLACLSFLHCLFYLTVSLLCFVLYCLILLIASGDAFMPRPVAFVHTNTHYFHQNLHVIPTQPHDVPLVHNQENHAPARAASTSHLASPAPSRHALQRSTATIQTSLGLAPAVLGSLPAGPGVGRPRA